MSLIQREHGLTLAALDPGIEIENEIDDADDVVIDSFAETNTDPDCFATVISRFDPLHKKKKYAISTHEIIRRVHSPEYMTVTKIEEYIRDSKRRSSELKRRLSDLAVNTKQNKRRMRTSAFTKWTEAESKEVVTSLEDDCTAYFPKDSVVGIIEKVVETDNEASKRSSIEKTKEILSAISNSITSVENFDNPVWSQYARITHEFGPWAMKYFLTMLIDSCDDLL